MHHTTPALVYPLQGLQLQNHQCDQTATSTTELHDGQHALLVDPGSCNNLAGGEWVRRGARLADAAGRTGIKSVKREQVLHVSGCLLYTSDAADE